MNFNYLRITYASCSNEASQVVEFFFLTLAIRIMDKSAAKSQWPKRLGFNGTYFCLEESFAEMQPEAICYFHNNPAVVQLVDSNILIFKAHGF